MSKKKFVIQINTNIKKKCKEEKIEKIIEKNFCNHICESIPLITKSFKFKILDHFLLGDEHVIKVSPGFSTPKTNKKSISSEEKKEIVLNDQQSFLFTYIFPNISTPNINFYKSVDIIYFINECRN